ncbi:MAG: hypothetical protein CL715_02605 [Chloroflexi bacterium]|nr:hypothetical protein [Chloroflexota bacterium]|tara:strand:- start:1731 stop:2345 length:615 start_codon:yes stop_codon:yes gene_type:complete
MNSKVIGLMLILGTILTMGVWIVFDIDTSGMSPSDSMTAILADKNKAEIASILNVFGVMSMFTGLYFLAKSLKSDNTVSNHFSEIGGLFLLLCVPLWVVLVGANLSAIDAAKEFGNDVGATIIASSTALQMGGILLVVGLFMLGISLTLLRKYKGIIGILFIIASVSAFIDMIFEIDIFGMIGWMGMFLMILITGILTTLKKEN